MIRKQDINDTYITIQGKGNKERHIAITPMLMKYMIKYDRIREFYFQDKMIPYDNYFYQGQRDH